MWPVLDRGNVQQKAGEDTERLQRKQLGSAVKCFYISSLCQQTMFAGAYAGKSCHRYSRQWNDPFILACSREYDQADHLVW